MRGCADPEVRQEDSIQDLTMWVTYSGGGCSGSSIGDIVPPAA